MYLPMSVAGSHAACITERRLWCFVQRPVSQSARCSQACVPYAVRLYAAERPTATVCPLAVRAGLSPPEHRLAPYVPPAACVFNTRGLLGGLYTGES